MRRTTLPLLGSLLLLGACMDRELPTATTPEGAAFSEAPAGTCVVTSAADASPAPEGSLRAAIADANCTTITFAAALNGQQILLTEDGGNESYLRITRPLTIDASALPRGVTLAGDGQRRVLRVDAGSAAPVVLRRLTITGGGGVRDGAGIFTIASRLRLEEVTVTANNTRDEVSTAGGGIYHQNAGGLEIVRSAIHGNWTRGQGGGILLDGGLHSVVNSTVSGNRAANHGGIWLHGELRLVGSTIYNNTGIFESFQLSSSSSASVRIHGSLLGGSGGGQDDCSLPTGQIQISHSFSQGGCRSLSASGDLGLEELGSYGGPTLTHRLTSSSPAIDAGVCSVIIDGTTYTLDTDQRGYARPTSGCDAGAFELGGIAPPVNDETPPTITLTTPADGAVYLLGQVVLADYRCEDEEGGSGLDSCSGTVPNGAAIHTGTLGTHTFTVDAEDHAGNTATEQHEYRVEYGFEGFEAPVQNGGVRNVAQAGRTIPLKWRLTDAAGNPVTTLSSAQVSVSFQAVLCEGGAPEGPPVPGEAAGASGLLNLGDGRYQFNWRTATNLANRCGTMHLNLGEGSTRTALFRFTR